MALRPFQYISNRISQKLHQLEREDESVKLNLATRAMFVWYFTHWLNASDVARADYYGMGIRFDMGPEENQQLIRNLKIARERNIEIMRERLRINEER